MLLLIDLLSRGRYQKPKWEIETPCFGRCRLVHNQTAVEGGFIFFPFHSNVQYSNPPTWPHTHLTTCVSKYICCPVCSLDPLQFLYVHHDELKKQQEINWHCYLVHMFRLKSKASTFKPSIGLWNRFWFCFYIGLTIEKNVLAIFCW